GIRINRNGEAHPIVVNDYASNTGKKARITYFDSNYTVSVPAEEIVFEFYGLTDIKATQN
ncbi:MAG: hypothetical protein IKC64_04310, partial [Clostridia bacterium]|nr:hypothetical protein [Clostridia bacterium]